MHINITIVYAIADSLIYFVYIIFSTVYAHISKKRKHRYKSLIRTKKKVHKNSQKICECKDLSYNSQ